MIRDYKNEMEFAEASREHGPWLFKSGEDGIVTPFFADEMGVYFKYLTDGDTYFVSYGVLASQYRWQDLTNCQIEEII